MQNNTSSPSKKARASSPAREGISSSAPGGSDLGSTPAAPSGDEDGEESNRRGKAGAVSVKGHLDLDRAMALERMKGNGKGKVNAGEQRRWRETSAVAVAAAAVGRDSGRDTAGACVARALSGFPGGGFEFLLGPFCVPPKQTSCFQCFFLTGVFS